MSWLSGPMENVIPIKPEVSMHNEPETAFDALAAGVPAPARAQLRWFEYQHLPADLQSIAEPFRDLAINLSVALAETDAPAELVVGLRRLLEAKDCMVRAAIGRR